MHYARFQNGLDADDPDSTQLKWVLSVFAVVCLLGAAFAWAWIPDMQGARGPGLALKNLTLEELVRENINVRKAGVPYGFRDKIRATWGRMKLRRRS